MHFSRNTIIEALELFEQEGWSTNQFERYLVRFKLEEIIPASLGSKPSRITALISHFVANPSLLGPSGANVVLETIEFILKSRAWSDPSNRYPSLSHSLQLDGYAMNTDGTLRTILPTSVSLGSKQTEVDRLLSQFGFAISNGHLEQALNAHTRGDWASANAQMRTFIESLFDSFADKLLNHPLPATSHSKREHLAKLNPPFFDPTLNEWDFKTPGGFVQGFWRLLHPNGSHPGLSDEDDCTFRLQLVYRVAHRFLKRFESYP
jgi:hypothetical protein